jgi:enoyl-[acyl-carrier protein] reductase II
MGEDTEDRWPPPFTTRITRMFGIRFPIIQAGMVWTAGSKLAVAVSRAGGLGLIGAGSMKPEVLRDQIRSANEATSSPVGVNVPLSRGDAEDLLNVAIAEGVRIIFTSSGHPGRHTDRLKTAGCLVVHVVAAVKHAKKAMEAGCDAVVAEGFEAGGHNGIDEITTMALVPQIADAVTVPVIAAGGIADGRGMVAALALGAEAVQVGTRFAATAESSSHETYKRLVVDAGDGDTVLTMRKLMPVRMLKTPFTMRVLEAEQRGATREELVTLLGAKRERQGIAEGNLEEGMFEAGQGAGLVHDVPPAAAVVRRMMEEFHATRERMGKDTL